MSLDQPNSFVKHQTPTSDAFLGGRLIVSQPSHGFRAGLDSVILGAAVSRESRTLLDLGAGAGVAGLVALANSPELSAVLVDREPEALALARANILANGLESRARAVDVDVTAKGSLRSAAGLPSEHFTTVIANPPFFERTRGTQAPHEGRAAARHMDSSESLDLWVKTAAMHAAPGGEIVFVHLAQALPDLLAAFDARFGAVTILPLAPRKGQECTRVLVRGIKGSKAPLRLLSARALHEEAGRNFSREFEGIFRGTGRLIW